MKQAIHILAIAALALMSFMAGRWTAPMHPRTMPQGDTLVLTDTVYRQAPPIVREVRVSVPTEVDTAAILATHYTKRIYTDTLINQPTLRVIVRDTVWKNSLLERTAITTYRPTIFRHTRSVSLGLAVSPHTLGVLAGYRIRGHEWMVGYDIHNRGPFTTYKQDLWQW